jgi:hypothetical protein
LHFITPGQTGKGSRFHQMSWHHGRSCRSLSVVFGVGASIVLLRTPPRVSCLLALDQALIRLVLQYVLPSFPPSLLGMKE